MPTTSITAEISSESSAVRACGPPARLRPLASWCRGPSLSDMFVLLLSALCADTVATSLDHQFHMYATSLNCFRGVIATALEHANHIHSASGQGLASAGSGVVAAGANATGF